MKDFRACPRKYEIRHERGIEPVRRSHALRFGSLFHLGLEHWWRSAASYPAHHADWLEAGLLAITTAPTDGSPADEYDVEKAHVLLCGYHARWVVDGMHTWQGQPIHVHGAEVPFTGPLVNPATGKASKTFTHDGTIDAICEIGGRFYAIEHKCIAGSAKIFNHANGLYEEARDLYARKVAPIVSAMANDGRLIVAQAKPLRLASERPIYEIATLGGRKLRVSGNHPVMTNRGWVTADSLTLTDWVATPKCMASTVSPCDLSHEQLRMIGYMIGDGSMTRMMFTKTDPRVLDDVVRCAGAMGEQVEIKYPNNRVPSVSFSQAIDGRYGGRVGPVAQLMKRCGLLGQKSADKRLPLHLSMSDHQLGQIIGALWSTDGCIDNNRTKVRIIYTSRSLGLCQDIQHALQRLGIVSNVRTTSVEYKGQRRPVSTTQVVGREAKQRFVLLALEGVIPVLRSRLSLDIAATMLSGPAPLAERHRQPYKHATVWWDRIESIRVDAPEQTYDVEVLEHHTFVVDGIITHNTSGEDFSPGSEYWQRLRLDTQIGHYLAGARHLGYELDGVLYDVIGKPALAPLLATPIEKRKYRTTDGALYANQREHDETPEEYALRLSDFVAANPEQCYARIILVRLERDEREAAIDAWQTAEEIRDAVRLNRFPRNPMSCRLYNHTCDYWPVCAGESSLDDETRYRKAEKQ